MVPSRVCEFFSEVQRSLEVASTTLRNVISFQVSGQLSVQLCSQLFSITSGLQSSQPSGQLCKVLVHGRIQVISRIVSCNLPQRTIGGTRDCETAISKRKLAFGLRAQCIFSSASSASENSSALLFQPACDFRVD